MICDPTCCYTYPFDVHQRQSMPMQVCASREKPSSGDGQKSIRINRIKFEISKSSSGGNFLKPLQDIPLSKRVEGERIMFAGAQWQWQDDERKFDFDGSSPRIQEPKGAASLDTFLKKLRLEQYIEIFEFEEITSRILKMLDCRDFGDPASARRKLRLALQDTGFRVMIGRYRR
ncbi:hypothetical protein FRX31_025811 [Thalictrum thalictroides]|uniref:Uncharacterized protein n=1 Tax=Thalictrum thalictroides TaxID=46969 RepID=A0A7J6VJW4_THATH|nr:hypothetical protein FRX31_025811 [Thalictrum thalictroides]